MCICKIFLILFYIFAIQESPRYPLELRKPTAELPKPISHDPSTKVLETENGIDTLGILF